jgi:disulfide bond formation protein DsbB
MWFYFIGLFLLVVGIAGSIVSGGIFTIVLLPLAVIALISAMLHSAAARKAQTRAGGATDQSARGAPEPAPLPSSQHANRAAAPSSPEQLADARRQQQ